MRKLGWIIAVALIAFGALSAHYTTGDSPHHREWAESHGMPPPSFPIFVMGMAVAVLGGAWAGWLLRRPRDLRR